MAADRNQMRRKISGEEARENYIMVLKKDLDFFPKVGKPFKLKVGGKEFESRVLAVECWCQGPQKPHSHYRIDTNPFRDLVQLRRGSKVTIEKQGDGQYALGT